MPSGSVPCPERLVPCGARRTSRPIGQAVRCTATQCRCRSRPLSNPSVHAGSRGFTWTAFMVPVRSRTPRRGPRKRRRYFGTITTAGAPHSGVSQWARRPEGTLRRATPPQFRCAPDRCRTHARRSIDPTTPHSSRTWMRWSHWLTRSGWSPSCNAALTTRQTDARRIRHLLCARRHPTQPPLLTRTHPPQLTRTGTSCSPPCGLT
mmetsp:Transcript_36243/g.115446  ORF Transcript_36243/g.115446 Transcript_36243/m.115446 type:complete len:206 (-) Transcript_36243:29-646(-)